MSDERHHPSRQRVFADRILGQMWQAKRVAGFRGDHFENAQRTQSNLPTLSGFAEATVALDLA
ncbi:hypothetical protein BRDID11002_70860 [Bradyrhizobium diazoefficiens]